jgi:hypothetical protein
MVKPTHKVVFTHWNGCKRRYETVAVTVEVELDLPKLAMELAKRVTLNLSGRTTLFYKTITAKRIEIEVLEHWKPSDPGHF